MDPERLEQLTRALAAGDRSVLEELLADQLPALQAYLRLRCDPRLSARESVADLAQSVCREALEHAERFRFPDEQGFRRWLFTTASRKLRDRQDFHFAQRRDAGREVDPKALSAVYGTLLSPSAVLSAREDLERVERAFAALPEEYREVITLQRIAGLGHAEIAEHMGRSEGAVRMLLHRALARLVAESEALAD